MEQHYHDSALASHLRSISLRISVMSAAQLAQRMGIRLWQPRRVIAQRQAERALQINGKVYGPDHPIGAISASNLGFILKDRGDLVGAQHQFERAFQIFGKAYGRDDPRTIAQQEALKSLKK